MSDPSVVPGADVAPFHAMQPRCLHPEPAPRRAAGEGAPLPGIALTKADCVLWAIALHRVAVAARLAGGKDR